MILNPEKIIYSESGTLSCRSHHHEMAGGPFGFSALMLGRRHICTMQMCYDDEDSSSYIVTKLYYHLPKKPLLVT